MTSSPTSPRVVIIGAGIGGLTTACLLAEHGYAVTVVERHQHVGGKIRTLPVQGIHVDAGPTVCTMRWVFDAICRQLGVSLDDVLPMQRATVLGRHFFEDGSELDLHGNIKDNIEAIGAFAGKQEAEAFRRFSDYAANLYQLSKEPFICSERPSLQGTMKSHGLASLAAPIRLDAYRSMMRALQGFFKDKRLRQLFGRYATYSGASPFAAPATLNLIADVEQQGVFLIPGGMSALARMFGQLAQKRGCKFQHGADVETLVVQQGKVRAVRLRDGQEIPAEIVVYNGDVRALSTAMLPAANRLPPLGASKGLSALIWTMVAKVQGRPLVRHNIYFAGDTRQEFESLFDKRVIPTDPTVYLCASDRQAVADKPSNSPERLFCLINAPAGIDRLQLGEQQRWTECLMRKLARMGTTLANLQGPAILDPGSFAADFPCSEGSLYGEPPHSWLSVFQRQGSRGPLPNLYLCGGTVHPGPGVPMAALSGCQAAVAVQQDHPLPSLSRRVVIPGGILMEKAQMASSALPSSP